ncbi:MAG TPA: MFS transporter [Polyangiaceae bacterium]|jgi:AAA family ATP:ADP antiporter
MGTAETKASDSRANATRGPLDKVLSIFADTHAGEGLSALLLTLSVFFLLVSYYLIKTAREPLILASGAEIKSYASVGQTLLLLPTTYFYGVLSHRVGRIKLITIVTLIFISNLFLFFALNLLGVPIGLAFYLWAGVFNMLSVAQFWSFAADVYTEEQGKRLFAILGIGSTVGAVAGSGIAALLVHPVGVYGMMIAAALFLLASLGLTILVHRRETKRGAEKAAANAGDEADRAEKPLGAEGGFQLILADRYLLLIAALAFILNCVKTNGEYILDRSLLEHVKTLLPGHADARAFSQAYIGEFKAQYFLYVNTATVLLQTFVVSRLIKHLGVRFALFVSPVLLFVGYSGSVLFPVLGLIYAVKITENTLDYSLGNTSRQALWLLTSRDEKYKAKSVIDATIVRAGDALTAGITFVGITLHFATVHFIIVNVVLIVVWSVGMMLLAREHKQREAAHGKQREHAAA